MAMPAHDRDPIVAVATAPGKGAVGIVRVSGFGLMPLARALCGRELKPRHAHYTTLLDEHGQAIDRGLVLYFEAPHSYTGQEVLELQVHGGPVVLQMLVERCLSSGAAPGLRPAEPGEFTRRAFLNGKLDLAQAEAVADLIDASTQEAARSAARSLQGEFSDRVNGLARQLLALRTLVEATLDFPEEELDFLQQADARGQLQSIATALERLQVQAQQGAILRDGLRVVIAGQPNVGKSSLLNALAGQAVAIVTPIAGTTRDRIEQALQIHGVPLHVVDTAGLREPSEAADEVERLGIERSWEAIASADAVMLVRDLGALDRAPVRAADQVIERQLLERGIDPGRWIRVDNKVDLAPAAARPVGEPVALRVSALTGQGLPELRQVLLERCGWRSLPEGATHARQRHRHALNGCAQHLARAQALLADPAAALDLLAEELRLAHRALGEITGQMDADDLLGVIFSSFCIGK